MKAPLLGWGEPEESQPDDIAVGLGTGRPWRAQVRIDRQASQTRIRKDGITSQMDPRLYELAAAAIGSSYCSLVHGQMLATSHYPAEKVASIATGEAAEALDAADAAVVRFAQKVAREAEKITQ
jgi:hypothetical protein